MAEVAGRPFLQHLLRYWSGQGIRRFLLSTGYMGAYIEQELGARFEGVELEYVREPEPLGTGGGLLFAYRQIQPEEPFLVLNGDTYFEVNLRNLSEMARSEKADWCLSLFVSTDKDRYMPVYNSAPGGLEFGAHFERARPDHEFLVNGGVYWIRPEALEPFEEKAGTKISLESELMPHGKALGQRFAGLRSDSVFIDIGVPEDYERAQHMTCFAEGP
jgi:D-glycero-alpha-D-manno-heptose 1-phosphate guanylyltransferase